MTAFQLDTSGVVPLWNENKLGVQVGPTYWSDLTPFAQGYVEALLRELDQQRMAAYRAAPFGSKGRSVPVVPRFSWLAPATLARIIADCERDALEPTDNPDLRLEGGAFWRLRNSTQYRDFPPLTPYLGDDGLIYLREAVG